MLRFRWRPDGSLPLIAGMRCLSGLRGLLQVRAEAVFDGLGGHFEALAEVDSVVDFAKRKNEPIALRRPVNLLGLIELAKFAGDAEVAFALGEAGRLGVLKEFEGGLEGSEQALLD